MIDLDQLEARVRRACAPWLPEDTAPLTLAVIAELRCARGERDEARQAFEHEKMARYGREMEAMEDADEARRERDALLAAMAEILGYGRESHTDAVNGLSDLLEAEAKANPDRAWVAAYRALPEPR
jgi:hypothetical protein